MIFESEESSSWPSLEEAEALKLGHKTKLSIFGLGCIHFLRAPATTHLTLSCQSCFRSLATSAARFVVPANPDTYKECSDRTLVHPGAKFGEARLSE